MRKSLELSAVTFAVALVLPACGMGGEVAGSDERLPCPQTVDADYGGEPTFDTPEQAVEHALEREPMDVVGSKGVEEYHRVERGDDFVDFEYRGDVDSPASDEGVHHTWTMARDNQGQWARASFSGCVPDDF